MKAWVFTGYGKIADRLARIDLPHPTAGPGQVVIEVAAAALNPIDYKTVAGIMRALIKYELPHPLGFDVAGVIAEAAPETPFAAGDRVFARASNRQMGTFADAVALDATDVARLPDEIPFPDGASLPLVALTTVQGLVERAKARPGQRILIQAGSGGLGTFAVQYAKAIGLTVTATCSSRNADFVRSLGADEIIAYDREDYRTRGPFFDIVFDTLGGEHTLASFDAVKPGGTVVSVGGPPDRDFARANGAGGLVALAMWAMNRRVYARADRAGAAYFRFLTESSGTTLADIARLQTERKIRAVIDRTYPMDEAPAAFAHLMTGRARGKIVLVQP
jgi:alcohol dehydrogenase